MSHQHEPSKHITFRLGPSLAARLEEAIAADGVTRTRFVLDAIVAKLAARVPEPSQGGIVRHGTAVLGTAPPTAPPPPRSGQKSNKRSRNSTTNVVPKAGGHAGCLRAANPEAYCRGCST